MGAVWDARLGGFEHVSPPSWDGKETLLAGELPTNRKWASSPQLLYGHCPHKNPIKTRVVTHLRFVGSEPPSTIHGIALAIAW